MSETSVTGTGRLGVRIVTAKMAASPKRQPSRHAHESDDEMPDEQSPPPPGMGKLVDRQA